MKKEKTTWVEKAGKAVVSVGHLLTKSKAGEIPKPIQENPQNLNQKDYWEALAKSRIWPNFWMTEEYAEIAELEWHQNGSEFGYKEPGQPGWIFPPLKGNTFATEDYVWAGFPHDIPQPPSEDFIFLDKMYIYYAPDFLNLEGSKWKVFRKNIKKYPAKNPSLCYRKLEQGEQEDEITDMLLNWAKGKQIADVVTMISFLLYGSKRWGLFNQDKLVGINVGDENTMHAVYRYCIDDGSPFLNEYMRYLFFTSPWVQMKRWVNDGGNMGFESLAKFKEKLNPTIILSVYTHPNGMETPEICL